MVAVTNLRINERVNVERPNYENALEALNYENGRIIPKLPIVGISIVFQIEKILKIC